MWAIEFVYENTSHLQIQIQKQIQKLAILGSRFIWRPRVYLTPAEGRAHLTQQEVHLHTMKLPQWSFQTTEPTSHQSVQTLIFVFLLISVVTLRCTDADNGVEGHAGAFVVSCCPRVAGNKDKEGAFEITHTLQNSWTLSHRNGANLCKKSFESLKRLQAIFELF